VIVNAVAVANATPVRMRWNFMFAPPASMKMG
jgi:hypothetical protein